MYYLNPALQLNHWFQGSRVPDRWKPETVFSSRQKDRTNPIVTVVGHMYIYIYILYYTDRYTRTL